ncbi:MAG: YncE family protein [Bryobacteraceae bacterium]
MQSLLLLCVSAGLVAAQSTAPLRLEKTIPLPDVQGRIDHMSIDVRNKRLFVAALGNNTVEVVDIGAGKRIHTISGLREPQGVLYLPEVNRLYVANAADGTLRIFDGVSFQLLKTLDYGDDADNVRYDVSNDQVYVGYGSGGLGALRKDGTKIRSIPLDSHPESFQLLKNGAEIYVNLPKSRRMAVLDRKAGSKIASYKTNGAWGNYPMALDEANRRLFVVCRTPATLLVFDISNGRIVAKLPAVGDCDDVFYDPGHRRIYATGSEGAIWVYQQQDRDHYQEVAKIPTAKGARTSFFSSDLGQLFVAVRRQASQPAAIRVYAVQ